MTDSGRSCIIGFMKHHIENKDNLTSAVLPSEGEGQLVEFKSMTAGINPKALAQTLVAFANTDGGDIYIGIADDGSITGTKTDTVNIDHILNAAREHCRPAVEITLQTIQLDVKRVIKIHVDRSVMLHSLSNGMVYVRVGSQDKRIIGEDIARLATAKSIVSLEDFPVSDAGISDLDDSLIRDLQNAPVNAHRMRRFSIEDALKAYQLIDSNGQLTTAAILLFAKEPAKWIFNAGATFVRFSGNYNDDTGSANEIDYLDREDFALPLVPLIDKMIEKIILAIEKGGRVTGVKRSENWEYPISVCRECVVNALAHRDYRIAGARVEVRLYADCFEVRSPGSLPGFMTIDTLGKRHYPRNPKLMRCLLDWGYVESLGLGIANVKKILAKLAFPPPEFENFMDEFRVRIQKSPFSAQQLKTVEKLSQADQTTLAYIYQHGSIDRKEYIKLHNVKLSRAKVELRDLVKRNLIQLEGKGPSSRYVVSK